ncbi:uncharacterized protein NEMAJ01_0239 [Nematocida major]|uniref:uncharacterized protein n=1 Tax=Nematocida major TaxID=1912982 RepID=UPI0020078C2A|nr:uncharacterized protein NEMAJ01_0239 [Nematocida major]KAH9385343.1 hypothetical protein NEMAJ01_0239 [Nematocida major]
MAAFEARMWFSNEMLFEEEELKTDLLLIFGMDRGGASKMIREACLRISWDDMHGLENLISVEKVSPHVKETRKNRRFYLSISRMLKENMSSVQSILACLENNPCLKERLLAPGATPEQRLRDFFHFSSLLLTAWVNAMYMLPRFRPAKQPSRLTQQALQDVYTMLLKKAVFTTENDARFFSKEGLQMQVLNMCRIGGMHESQIESEELSNIFLDYKNITSIEKVVSEIKLVFERELDYREEAMSNGMDYFMDPGMESMLITLKIIINNWDTIMSAENRVQELFYSQDLLEALAGLDIDDPESIRAFHSAALDYVQKIQQDQSVDMPFCKDIQLKEENQEALYASSVYQNTKRELVKEARAFLHVEDIELFSKVDESLYRCSMEPFLSIIPEVAEEKGLEYGRKAQEEPSGKEGMDVLEEAEEEHRMDKPDIEPSCQREASPQEAWNDEAGLYANTHLEREKESECSLESEKETGEAYSELVEADRNALLEEECAGIDTKPAVELKECGHTLIESLGEHAEEEQPGFVGLQETPAIPEQDFASGSVARLKQTGRKAHKSSPIELAKRKNAHSQKREEQGFFETQSVLIAFVFAAVYMGICTYSCRMAYLLMHTKKCSFTVGREASLVFLVVMKALSAAGVILCGIFQALLISKAIKKSRRALAVGLAACILASFLLGLCIPQCIDALTTRWYNLWAICTLLEVCGAMIFTKAPCAIVSRRIKSPLEKISIDLARILLIALPFLMLITHIVLCKIEALDKRLVTI